MSVERAKHVGFVAEAFVTPPNGRTQVDVGGVQAGRIVAILRALDAPAHQSGGLRRSIC